jgi:hypothetical protein
MNKLINKILEISNTIRYVAIYHDNELISKKRIDLTDASKSESDKYEELFVNPTILKIAAQRGRLDCGGLDFIIIRYGNFYQMIREFKNGHISICIDKQQNPIDLEKIIKSMLDNV